MTFINVHPVYLNYFYKHDKNTAQVLITFLIHGEVFKIFFAGQVVDSLATPVAGWAIDYTGHRRLWHLGGSCHNIFQQILLNIKLISVI